MTRAQLLARAANLRQEIVQISADADHWNRLHPSEPIDPDPDGELGRMRAALERALAVEHTDSTVPVFSSSKE